ncbi:MAG TPA: dihydrolipoyl dehydrogenase [Candidatus Poseidoniales archaeon]|jgi:dihydrolipoamide dehydrogenase|nr:MAG TPA: dihydrolipoyl dehydrogenase [Candidatus Poseidoniales archaeon]DAC45071.1 MAG TPA: dihydrolipoyl dehydrogenase [Candidatus Poseidoniales archaeon]HII22099.1 dihydrolipoyl dehydrogenase [Candidatus Poseidoniaceae archaeon]HII87181.1 dihydrolipoyl dehydrogenase [Candidatus Poseidoniaceae archaeon]|tara:strand:- start:168 stop:1598 length:1431 start_codon:yes stop_codon:yes gene_type:complete
METKKCQVLVIGAGPGGYVAAIRAGQLGLKTIIVEGEKAGGTCLIRGCIPSKALIHAAHRFHDLAKHAAKDGHMGISIPGPAELNMADLVGWKENIVTRLNKGVEHLLKNAGAELITGWAEFQDAKTVKIGKGKDAIIVQADHVILANGSVPIELPFMPYDEHVISSREALSLETLPEHVAIVGGGYIGLELGITFRMLGSEVTVVEAMDSVLPIFDKELRRPLEIAIKKQKIKTHLGVFAKGTEATKDGRVQLNFIDKNEKDEKKMQHVVVDKVLVTVGRKPNSASLAPTGVALDERGFVKVNDRCETNMKGVYAIGDVCDSGEMLAHVASFQGEMVAEIIAGKKRAYDPVAVPAIVFTEPEIVSVGLSPEEAKAAGHPVIIGKFPLGANGRALTQEAEKSAGFIRICAREDDHRILGIQGVGTHISELVGEWTLALEMGALLEDVAGTIHAHPTMTEMTHEAVLATLGHAIHSA